MTFLHPAVLVAVVIAGLLMLTLPRKKAVVPFLLAAILIPSDQVLLIGPLHFPMVRMLVLFALARVLKGKYGERLNVFSGGFNRLDLAVIVLSGIAALNAMLLWQESQALIAQLGDLYTVFGAYFFLRYVIRDSDDMSVTIRTIAVIVVLVGALMAYEQATRWNPYALLGGSRSSIYATGLERDGRFRAMGSFAHPILAGTFGAVVIPLFIGLWMKDRKQRTIALVGIVGASAMTLACNSSTPLFAYIAGLLGLCLWPMRQYMRVIRWGIVFTLVSLHLVMKAPVWHLISRIDLSGGSSSYHRYMLVDGFIRHFGDWWLFGTKSNADWGWCMWDAANQYVAIGETSGLSAFVCFVAVIACGFKFAGRARRASGTSRRTQLFLWALGSALFANAVAFFGISYFDQTSVMWYAVLAMLSTTLAIRQETAVAQPSPKLESIASSDALLPVDVGFL